VRTATAGKLVSIAILVLIAAGACSASAAGPTGGDASLPPDAIVTSPPGGGRAPPGDPQPSFVVPTSGQLEPRAVNISKLSATVDGRNVTVQADWWSGVEPCNVLDSIKVVRDGQTFTVTLLEGHGAEPVACIEIAVFKATMFSLGRLEPGTYTIRAASGDAQPIPVTIP
jgi:hypothetical protein